MNAALHPVMAQALAPFIPPLSIVRVAPARKPLCHVTVHLNNHPDGVECVTFAGSFDSTVDATMAAMDMYPTATRISVRVLP